MKFKHIFYCLFLSVALLSCSETDTESYCPTWKGFTYYTGSHPNYVQHPNYIQGSPISLSPNDSVHVTAHQDQRGHLINSTDYIWTVCYDTLDTKNNADPDDDVVVHVRKTLPSSDLYPGSHTNYDGYVNGQDDPVAHFILSKNAVASTNPDTIVFVARYMYSGHGKIYETGNIVENTSYNGRIVPQSNSYDGGATGNILFRVSN